MIIKMLSDHQFSEAENKDEAFGKFIADTTRLEFLQRIEPVSCFEFYHLKTI